MSPLSFACLFFYCPAIRSKIQVGRGIDSFFVGHWYHRGQGHPLGEILPEDTTSTVAGQRDVYVVTVTEPGSGGILISES